MTKRINEGAWDTIKTVGKAAWDRNRDAALAGAAQGIRNAGLNVSAPAATGRLSIRLIADKFSHLWQQYLASQRYGGNKLEGNAQDMRNFIQQSINKGYLGTEASATVDRMLQKISGEPQAAQTAPDYEMKNVPVSASPNTTPTGTSAYNLTTNLGTVAGASPAPAAEPVQAPAPAPASPSASPTPAQPDSYEMKNVPANAQQYKMAAAPPSNYQMNNISATAAPNNPQPRNALDPRNPPTNPLAAGTTPYSLKAKVNPNVANAPGQSESRKLRGQVIMERALQRSEVDQIMRALAAAENAAGRITTEPNDTGGENTGNASGSSRSNRSRTSSSVGRMSPDAMLHTVITMDGINSAKERVRIDPSDEAQIIDLLKKHNDGMRLSDLVRQLPKVSGTTLGALIWAMARS